MQVELAQVRAMLQEICAATHGSIRARQEIMKIGTGKTNWDELENIDELAGIVLTTKRAVSDMKEGKVAFDAQSWRNFEDIYYQRVIKPLFL